MCYQSIEYYPNVFVFLCVATIFFFFQNSWFQSDCVFHLLHSGFESDAIFQAIRRTRSHIHLPKVLVMMMCILESLFP